MRTVSGKASRMFSPIVGELSFTGKPFYARSEAILVSDAITSKSLGYSGCITTGPQRAFFYPDSIYDADDISFLHEGDIVCLDSDGHATVLWEESSNQNALFLTEACNCHCMMCPQPPKKHDKRLIQQANKVLDLIKLKSVRHICITGGEPTLLGNDFLAVLNRCVSEHPSAIIDILTNGKTFFDINFTQRVASITNKNVKFCVSLHSDIDTIHDKIVGKNGSYSKTQLGIYNLAKCGCHLEIRHVVTKLNWNRLLGFSEHLYNYFPFCSHYAFMGMEVHGEASLNYSEVGISPNDYRENLRKAVLFMHRRGLPVSVYNIPLCQCDERIWPFARQSISSWKNFYPSQCDQCREKAACAGFFSTSAFLPAELVKPI